MNGWFAIGVQRPKTAVNHGTLWRSAASLGAAYIFTIGRRFEKESSDVTNSWTKIPVFHYRTFDEFLANRPYDAPLIGVELTEGAVSLETYRHPDRAIYLLGPEDGSLSLEAQLACRDIVKFNSAWCLNVATAGSIVMYDRQTKSAVRQLEKWGA